MPRVPKNVSELIAFCNEHVSAWTGSPTNVGLSAPQVLLLKNQAADATAAVAAQLAAKVAAKSTTLTANKKVADLRKTIAGCIRSIVTFAEAATDPLAVFALAQIDPTSPRTPSVPPGQPTDMTATLDTDGNLTLKWKCANPPGGSVVYSIMRRDGAMGTFAQVGLVGGRTFTDESIPAGVDGGVTYQIRALRGQLTGPASLMFTLQFGHGGGGSVFKTSTEKVPFRVAA